MKRHSKLRSQLAVASVGMSVLLVAQASKATSIGQTYIHSQQNEPLLASIDINDVNTKDFSVSIANESTYHNMGLDSSTPIQVAFVKKTATSGALILTSRQPIYEPFADVVLLVNNKGQSKSVPTTLLLPLDKPDHLLTNLNKHPLSKLDSDEERHAKQEAFALAQQVQVRSPFKQSPNSLQHNDSFEYDDSFEPLILSKHFMPPLLNPTPHDSNLAFNVLMDTAQNHHLTENLTPYLDGQFKQDDSEYQPLNVQTKSPPYLFAKSIQNNIHVNRSNTLKDLVERKRSSQNPPSSTHAMNAPSFETLVVSNQTPPLLNDQGDIAFHNTIDVPVMATVNDNINQHTIALMSDASEDIANISNAKADSAMYRHFEPLNIVSNSAPELHENSLDGHTYHTKFNPMQHDSDAIVLNVKRTITSVIPNTSVMPNTMVAQSHEIDANGESKDEIVNVVNVKVMHYLEQINQQHDDEVVISSNSATHQIKTI